MFTNLDAPGVCAQGGQVGVHVQAHVLLLEVVSDQTLTEVSQTGGT